MNKISVIVPAHNEEKYIGQCLSSIEEASRNTAVPVETIVVLNRCTDKTTEIASAYSAITVTEEAKNLAKIRNRGVRAASGDVIVTIDADSRMQANALSEVVRLLETKRYIGGGIWLRIDRFSLGIFFSLLSALPKVMWRGIPSAGMFWLYKSTFDAIGGFDESFVSAEDVQFAKRLKAYGKSQALKYGTIHRSHIVTSARKFDEFGDWHMLTRREFKGLLDGKDQQAANKYYYDIER